MSEHLRIVRGSPTDEEARAVEAAIRALALEAEREGARAAGIDAWTMAARAAGTGRGPRALPRGPEAWRRSGGIASEPTSTTQTGRGDAK